MWRKESLALVLLLGAGCHAHKGRWVQPAEAATTSNVSVVDQASFSGGDGTSCAQAVVVHASNEGEGVRSEYRWIAERFPGYRTDSQALAMSGGRSYDEITFTTASGETKVICFDITEFFGKF